MEATKRICLWSGPRNISTALMYSFAQRKDCKVVDEPLYGFYLSNSESKRYHPGADEIMNSMDCDGVRILESMMESDEKQVLFYKHMTHHLLALDYSFLKLVDNVILTRDPREMILSYSKVIPNPKMHDLGYDDHLKIVDYLVSINKEPIVLDARELLINPEKVLKELCRRLAIPFYPAMLNWKAGPIKEDGIWAKYWYANVHKSTGFKKYKPNSERFPSHLFALLEECLPIYKQLSMYAIKA